MYPINESARKKRSEWYKKKTESFYFLFNREKDKKIIEKLYAVGNRTDYVRQLILEDIDTADILNKNE